MARVAISFRPRKINGGMNPGSEIDEAPGALVANGHGCAPWLPSNDNASPRRFSTEMPPAGTLKPRRKPVFFELPIEFN